MTDSKPCPVEVESLIVFVGILKREHL